jgi:hypothetical protein
MGIFDKLFNKEQPVKEEEVKSPAAESAPKVINAQDKPKATKTKKPAQPKKTPKQIATEKGEPYVNIISVDLDPENIGNGAFELDWNDFFVAKLVRSGYKGKDDSQIVDQWFQDVCRNVVMETFEQYEANNPRPVTGVKRRDLGDGRSEIG